jgi:phenylacetate-coenzyme A ligase PaaK-like adenylate-forming protein
MLPILIDLVKFHYQNCAEYRNILDALRFDYSTVVSIEDLPFLPARLFKELELLSVPFEEITKVMKSSGTSSQIPSKIYIDRNTALLQRRVLAKIISEFIGTKRRPMVIIDRKSSVSNRTTFSASVAGILGFTSFSNDQFYALNDDMSVNVLGLTEFLSLHNTETVFFFGFTSLIWQYFLLPLADAEFSAVLPDSMFIHGGGWKKLQSENISRDEFRNKIFDILHIEKVHDYYGMVEQTGSIFVECSQHYFHTSNFSTVIVRDPKDLSVLKFGQIGLIEVISIVALSYPGHVLLTEDLGRVVGEDTCTCGRHGKYFEILGRLEKSELRGCSDTFYV